MNRVAVCVSGIGKYWSRCKNSIQKYIPEADIFIHTWLLKEEDINPLTMYSHDLYNEMAGPSQLIEEYRPRAHKVDILSNFRQEWQDRKDRYEKQGITIGQHSTSLQGMFYSMEEACNLKIKYEQDNNFKYNLVYRMRFDSDACSWYNNDIETNTIYIPEGRNNSFKGVNDQFCYGESASFDKACRCYTNLENIVQSLQLYHPEVNFAYNLEYSKLTIKRVPMEININGKSTA